MTSSSTDVIRIVLLAFLGGLAAPVLVQLFLTLRTLRQSSLAIERRVQEASHDLATILAGVRRESNSGPDLASLIASAAAPALIAAVRAFRAPAPTAAPNGVHAPHQETTS
jgi:hypothetical protein